MTLSLQANRSNWMAVQQSLKWILPMYQEPTHNLFLTQLWHRGQPNHILPADPRLHRPDQQVRHVLPPATSRQRLDVRRCESQPATWLWEDQGIQSHNSCWGEFLKSKSLSVCFATTPNFSSISRTMELNSLPAKPPSSSCWRTSTTRFPSSPRESKRLWWRASRLGPQSPGWSSFPNGGNRRRGVDQVAVPHCVPFILIIHSQESHSPYMLPFSTSAL